MNLKIKILFFLHFIIQFAFSQNPIIEAKGHSDFAKALKITMDSNYIFSSPVSFGDILEVGSRIKFDTIFEKEHNTIWLSFEADIECYLEFDIIPSQATDDYDFMLYQTDILNKNPSLSDYILIRSNISRNITDQGGATGLRRNETINFVKSGPGKSYSNGIFTGKKKYLLLIDNVYGSGNGFRLNFKKTDCKYSSSKKTYKARIEFVDKQTGMNIDAACILVETDLLGYPKDTVFSGVYYSKDFLLESEKSYVLISTKRTYLKTRNEINCDTNKSLNIFKIELDSLFIGKKITLDNLYFVGGTPQILRKSLPVLKQLAQVLKDNPDLQIDIQGHVNGPLNSSERKTAKYNQDLSEARCKEVIEYLVKKGIRRERMTFHGYGNSKMLFPYAQNETEMEKNRRVEIEIVSF